MLEAPHAFRIGSDVLPEHLDGHVPPELQVLRPVDLTHSTGADGGDEFVVAKLGSGGKSHAICLVPSSF